MSECLNEPWETTTKYGRADLTIHPIMREAYKVACLIERCGASVELTAASSAAFALCERLFDVFMERHRSHQFSASERLHNICDALSAHADESPFTREEWERVDAENVRLRQQRDELLAIARRYAAECGLCGGHSMRRRLDVDGVPLDDVSCEHCADVRLVIARAEGRS